MRKEKVAGYVGLALFSLFPLLGAFQADETDTGWRQVATRTRRSVLGVQIRSASETSSQPMGCAVVLSNSPLRAVIAGAVADAELCSVEGKDRVDWRTTYVDPHGEFTILEGIGPGRIGIPPAGQSSLLAGVVALDPATFGDLGAAGQASDVVDAVLVGPAGLATPLWIGELRFERSRDRRPAYAGENLRALRDTLESRGVAVADSEGQRGARFPIDPALRGAPFVTLEGVVLGLYVGDRDGRPHAVPMALVREALAGMDRRAAR